MSHTILILAGAISLLVPALLATLLGHDHTSVTLYAGIILISLLYTPLLSNVIAVHSATLLCALEDDQADNSEENPSQISENEKP